jgi:hypothetical protein
MSFMISVDHAPEIARCCLADGAEIVMNEHKEGYDEARNNVDEIR